MWLSRDQGGAAKARSKHRGSLLGRRDPAKRAACEGGPGGWTRARSERPRPEGSGTGRGLVEPEGWSRSEHAVRDEGSRSERPEGRVRLARTKKRAWFEEQRRSFLDAARVKAQDQFAKPATSERLGATVPRFPGQDRQLRKRAQEEYRAWLVAHREALERWRGDDRDAEFPPGTWWMRVFHRVECAEAEPLLAPP